MQRMIRDFLLDRLPAYGLTSELINRLVDTCERDMLIWTVHEVCRDKGIGTTNARLRGLSVISGVDFERLQYIRFKIKPKPPKNVANAIGIVTSRLSNNESFWGYLATYVPKIVRTIATEELLVEGVDVETISERVGVKVSAVKRIRRRYMPIYVAKKGG